MFDYDNKLLVFKLLYMQLLEDAMIIYYKIVDSIGANIYNDIIACRSTLRYFYEHVMHQKN